MEDDDAFLIILAIHRASQPISGWLESPPGMRRPFVGMLELVGLLEGARASGAGEGSGG